MNYLLAIVAGFILVGLSSSSVIPLEEEFKQKKENGKNEDTLLMANVIYRHGEREMTGSMQLTNQGKEEMFKLGEYFRFRYHDILGEKYVPERIYTISTDFDRSIMSAQANLAGLFKPKKNEIWHDDLMWQPVPVHTISKESDNILRPRYGDRCPKYGVMYDYYMQNSPDALEMKSKYGKYFEFWEQKSGDRIHTIEDAFSIYKRIIADKDSGKKLEKWEKEAIKPDGPLDEISKAVYKLRGLPELVRIRCGFLISEMLNRFEWKLKPINGTLPELALYIYSGHSSTITTLMNGLGLDQEEIPDHGSAFLFELYENKKSKEHYVQIRLRMPDQEYPVPKKIPGCGKSCPLEKFRVIYGPLIPGKFKDECKL